VENGFGYLESFVKSETGRRLVGVIPRLVAAKNMEKMLEVRKDDIQSKTLGSKSGYVNGPNINVLHINPSLLQPGKVGFKSILVS
jgi:hypothetical protein